MYSVVRNPLYLGNFFMGLSIALFLHLWWIPLIYTLSFAIYYERIIFAEEMFLRQKFGEEYVEWASRTPAFIPKLSLWRKPDLSFSLRTVIKREYQSLYGLIVTLFTIELILECYLNHALFIQMMWAGILLVTTFLYLIVRILHLRTSLLNVNGR
jgi:protein-S-isoprenylcysteine O-methyltransferase Ste14